MNWIIPLENAASDVGLAGGKGANLGILIGAGLPVPPGFVLTTTAYQEFISAAGLQAVIEAAGQHQPGARIAEAFARAAIPDNLAAAVSSAYADLGGTPVAVRSSVTTYEDPGAPFAGQGDTVLQVLGEDALLAAVKHCWASLWSEQAIAYRASLNLSPAQASMAIIVQHQVRAEVSGVIFTANRETRNAEEMVIRAAQGLGKEVLSGNTKPQEIIFNRHSRSITRQSMPGKLIIMPDQALELVRLGEQIEYHFGLPQSIEWAWDEDQFYILQSRPITEPILPRIRWEAPVQGASYSRQSMDLLPGPVSTLFETTGLPAFEQGIHAYQVRSGLAESQMSLGFATINGFVYARVHPRSTRLRLLPRFHRPSPKGIYDQWEQEALPAYRREVGELQGGHAGLRARDLADRIVQLAQSCGRYWAVVTPVLEQVEQDEQRFLSYCRRVTRPGDPHPLVFLTGLDTRLLEAERALYDGQEQPETFARTFGHALYNLDFAVPLAAEDPSGFEAARRAWQSGVESPQGRFERLRAERLKAEELVRAHLRPWQQRVFNEYLAAAQRAAHIRENALFELGLAWLPLRGFALQLGQQLVQAGALEQPEQVFWLRRNELQVLAAGLEAGKEWIASQAAKVRARQAAWEAARELHPPFQVPEPVKHEPVDGKTIRGTACSCGQAAGVARVVHGPEEFHRLGVGEILVTHSLPPAWTLLLELAGGLVTDLGGPGSHCPAAARAHGIPAVTGTHQATARITDGQVISIDCDSGSVNLQP